MPDRSVTIPIDEPGRYQTPTLIVRLDRVRDNIERMRQAVGGRLERWRPHVKTVKIPQVLRLMLDTGVRRFKCATTREAAVLLDTVEQAGVESIDLLTAMSLRGRNLERLVELAGRHRQSTLSLLTEEPGHAALLRRDAAGLGVFVDLDPGFGRSGIPGHDVARLDACIDAVGPALRGLHFYEGHVRDADPARRRAACDPLFERLVTLADRQTARGVRADELITSGTPTFLEALSTPALERFDHQIGPGTVVYWDGTSETFGIDGFSPAATVVSRVVGRAGPRRATCDAGSKAIDAACGDPCARVAGRPDLIARTPSEEHLPIAALGDRDAPAAGTLLELIPRHVCPTVNLASEAVLLDATSEQVVPVAARGHEV